MKRALALLLLFLSLAAQAHVGSPDVYYDGMVGPYPARVTIRVPNVVPGRAEISVRVQTAEPVDVSFLPLYSRTAISNAPPPDLGHLIIGETNLYAGELWLMSFGAYSVEVRIKGPQGEGATQIPVTSVAIRQLPMPSLLGKVLLCLAAILVLGGIGVAAAGFREATLTPGASPKKSERIKGLCAAAITAAIFAWALVGGKSWWTSEENAFRRHLREGAWPDLTADVQLRDAQRFLRLEVGKEALQGNNNSSLIPDHGKLMHLFLIREGSRDAFAHLHPIRKSGYNFEVALPPLPEGRYAIFCDLTFEGGMSSTATNSVVLPPVPIAAQPSDYAVRHDPDDSWFAAGVSGEPTTAAAANDPVCRLPEGIQVAWQPPPATLRIKQDAGLRFTVTDLAGEPVHLEPYMGMLCHAAILRNDGSVFVHLHPSGNFSMAAHSYFENKLAKEGKPPSGAQEISAAVDSNPGMNHNDTNRAASSIYLPYEFPTPGDYRIWVQFKIGTRIRTAVFDAHVGA